MVRPGAIFGTAGLVLNAVGVVILFFKAVPYIIDTGGNAILVAETGDQKEGQRIARAKKFAFGGLGLVIAGTILQLISLWT